MQITSRVLPPGHRASVAVSLSCPCHTHGSQLVVRPTIASGHHAVLIGATATPHEHKGNQQPELEIASGSVADPRQSNPYDELFRGRH